MGSAAAAAMSAQSAAQDAYEEDVTQAEDEEYVDEIVVRGIRQSLEDAREKKRAADQIQDVVTAEDIGKLPDTNVADALQRITGVQINRELGEGAEVAVRGFSQNRIEVNGQTQVGATAGRSSRPCLQTPSRASRSSRRPPPTTSRAASARSSG